MCAYYFIFSANICYIVLQQVLCWPSVETSWVSFVVLCNSIKSENFKLRIDGNAFFLFILCKNVKWKENKLNILSRINNFRFLNIQGFLKPSYLEWTNSWTFFFLFFLFMLDWNFRIFCCLYHRNVPYVGKYIQAPFASAVQAQTRKLHGGGSGNQPDVSSFFYSVWFELNKN